MSYLSEVKRILKSQNLSVTESRIEVLTHLIEVNRTVSLRDLEKELDTLDRVTLYRTVKSFTQKDIIHKIPSDDGHARYGMSLVSCEPDDHSQDHMHFKCTACGKIECLDQYIPAVKVPGYLIKQADLILKGICKICVT